MIEIPEDPIEVIIQRFKHYAHIIALHLQDEAVIISVGMSDPNKIVTTPLFFEKLESEPSPRRRVAQQLRRSEERTHKRLVERATKLITSLYAAHSV